MRHDKQERQSVVTINGRRHTATVTDHRISLDRKQILALIDKTTGVRLPTPRTPFLITLGDRIHPERNVSMLFEPQNHSDNVQGFDEILITWTEAHVVDEGD